MRSFPIVITLQNYLLFTLWCCRQRGGSSSHLCKPIQNPLLQSPSCNEGAKDKLPTEQCCPQCCQNTTGFCENDCNFKRCLAENSASHPWSRAYTGKDDRRSFMVVLQRPFAWTAPFECRCGDAKSLLTQLSPEPLDKSNTPGFEETSTHLRQRDRDRHGCCTPPANHNWHTRNLQCTFETPCALEVLKLGYSDGGVEDATVETMTAMGGAAVCMPRYGRKLAQGHLNSNYLHDWLKHYGERDTTHVFLYSDECVDEVLTPTVLAHQREGSGVSVVNLVDISQVREFPAWYHNQVLAMRDCWARAAAGGATWMLSLDADELLLVPPGWSSAPAFAPAQALSFGSLNPCSSAENSRPCERTASGHRKYALRSAANHNSLSPPSFIHGDPQEMALSTNSGMFVMHFSRCELEGFKRRSSMGGWLSAVLAERSSNWHAEATLDTLQNSSGTAPPKSCGLRRPWTYY